MRRRDFVAAVAGAVAAAPLAARAQQPERIARIGFLGINSTLDKGRGYGGQAFMERLRELGYIEGRNLQLEYRSADGDEGRLPALAGELVGLNVDVIVTYSTGAFAAREATSTIPIVVATAGDAIATGLAPSLAHPGGNVTGLTFFAPQLLTKRLELLKESVPALKIAGVLLLRGNPLNGNVLEVMQSAAGLLKVDLQTVEVRGAGELEGAFSAWAAKQANGCVIADPAEFIRNAARIADLAASLRLPAIGALELSRNGGLIGYGVDFIDMWRRAAIIVDKILKGARPGDIPIERATKFTTIVNLKTAKALGLDIPPAVLAGADEVIE